MAGLPLLINSPRHRMELVPQTWRSRGIDHVFEIGATHHFVLEAPQIDVVFGKADALPVLAKYLDLPL
jgi:hypothetical protein